MSYSIKPKLFENEIQWLSTKEAADYLRISVNALKAYVSRGQVPIHGRLGRKWRFRKDLLDDLLQSSN